MTSPARTAAERGFTLIEMLIVVTILALVGGLVMARGPMRSRGLEARAAASEIARMLRGARGQAIGRDHAVLVVIDAGKRAIAVDGGPIRTLPGSFAVSVRAARGEVRDQKAGIVFEPDGSASGGRITLADGSRRIAIAVDWLTGRVSIAETTAS